MDKLFCSLSNRASTRSRSADKQARPEPADRNGCNGAINSSIGSTDSAGARSCAKRIGRLYLEAPKNRKRRRTIYPKATPCGFPLAERIEARIKEAAGDFHDFAVDVDDPAVNRWSISPWVVEFPFPALVAADLHAVVSHVLCPVTCALCWAAS